MNQKWLNKKNCILVALNPKMTAFAILSIILVYWNIVCDFPLYSKKTVKRALKNNKNSKWYLVAFGMIEQHFRVTFISVPGEVVLPSEQFKYFQFVLECNGLYINS
jgi:hypothetical protein